MPASAHMACRISAASCRSRSGRHHQREGQVGLARLLQELLGLGHVALGHRDLLVIVGIRGADELVARDVLATEHGLDQGFPIDRQVEGLAHPHVGERLALRAVGHVQRDHLVAQLGHAGDFELGIPTDFREVGRRHALDHLEIAGAQAGQARARVGDGHELDAVDGEGVLVPVVGHLLQHDLALGHPLHELVRPGADRLGAQLVAEGLRRLGRDHHAGAVGQGGQQGHQRLREVEAHREVVHHLHATGSRRSPACGTSPACSGAARC